MKRFFSLFTLLVLLSCMVISAAGVSMIENANQCVAVVSATDGVRESTVLKYLHLQDADMVKIVEASIEKEEGIIPEDAKIQHMTMIRQKDVVCDVTPIEYSFHAWSAVDRHLVMFFKAEGEEQWGIVAYAFGKDIDVSLPGNGQYALAWGW